VSRSTTNAATAVGQAHAGILGTGRAVALLQDTAGAMPQGVAAQRQRLCATVQGQRPVATPACRDPGLSRRSTTPRWGTEMVTISTGKDPMSDTPEAPKTDLPETETQQAVAEAPQDTQPAATPSDAERIAALEAELAAMRDKWLRAEAEMQNLRTRTRREIEDARLFAVQKFARDVVETADNLRRGLDSLPPEQEAEAELLTKLRGGFAGVERGFVAMLERHGITRQDAQGQPFNPELHEAMSEQPAPEGVPGGTVIQAWTPSWSLNGRLLKAAMVVVAAKG
jgi:molecular chaperone GrpE